MIPPTSQPLRLSKKGAQVRHVGLPTEKHGEGRKAFVDIGLLIILEADDVDALLIDAENKSLMGAKPSSLLWCEETAQPRLASLEQKGALRPEIAGSLKLDDLKELEAHTVGSANHLTIGTGSSAQLSLTFRMDPPAAMLAHLRRLAENGTCVVTFEEDLAEVEDDEQQENLPV